MFEGRKRIAIAEEGLKELRDRVDSLITVPNEKLLMVLGKTTSLLEAFKAANDVLLGAVQGIADLIINPGIINVDFADVRTVMSEMGQAMMGTGQAVGEDRAREAAELAIHSPLLEDIDLQGARGILVNITAGPDLSLGEFTDVGDTVEEFASDNATVVVGTVIDPNMGSDLRVTVVATGLCSSNERAAPKKIIDNTLAEAQPTLIKADGELDYGELDKPAHIRQQRSAGGAQQSSAARKIEMRTEPDMDYLDIPAFLRRQAD